LATKRVACPECSATVPYGRLSCPTCGTLLASVAGSTRRVSLRPSGRRARGTTATAVVGPAGHGLGHKLGLEVDPEGASAVPRPAATERALASAIDRPANGLTPATEMPSVLHDWVAPPQSVAAGEPGPIGRGRAIGEPVASTGVVAELDWPSPDVAAGWRSADATARQADGPQIPGAYLAPSATRRLALQPEVGPTRVHHVTSRSPVPGPNQWYSVPDAPGGPPAAATATVSSSPGTAPTMAGAARSVAGPHGLTAGEAGLLSDLPFAAPNGPSGWATAVGGGLAALAVVLPWAKNGVSGGQLSPGYLGQWGLANPAYLLLLGAGLAMLLVTILPNRLPRALREVALPLVLGGFLLGLVWSYATGPFGTGLGVGTMLVGAGLLVTGGALGLRSSRRSLAPSDTST
jgi:hypothetical protein